MSYLDDLLLYFQDFTCDDFVDFFEVTPNELYNTNLLLSLEKDFDIRIVFNNLLNSDSVVRFLYENDIQLFISAIIQNNHANGFTDIGLMDEYNRIEKEHENNLEELDSSDDLPYLYMSDVKEYCLETKNYKYKYEYCSGEEWILVSGLLLKN
jgi:hypothetical protein